MPETPTARLAPHARRVDARVAAEEARNVREVFQAEYWLALGCNLGAKLLVVGDERDALFGGELGALARRLAADLDRPFCLAAEALDDDELG